MEKLQELAKRFKESVPLIEIKERVLMDETAPNASTGVINGQSSNVLNWDDTHYKWAYPLFKRMLGNFWTAFEINMSADIKDFPNMTDEQQDTFLKIIGLLAFLDSLQTDYSGRIAEALSDSSLHSLMIILAQQEVVHNHSYSYILSSVVDRTKQEEVFEYWKHDDVLKKRNHFVLEGYEAFVQENTVASMLSSIAYDVILEGLFFYSGFAFFYDLARSGKMVATSTMINYINRDEQQHVRLFCDIFHAILEENPAFDTPELHAYITEMYRQAAEHEIAWSNYVIGTKFDTINVKELEGYIKFMANLRVRMLLGKKAEPPFPKQETNPMEWIKFYEDVDLGKTDFFEQKNRQYEKPQDGYNREEDVEINEEEFDI